MNANKEALHPVVTSPDDDAPDLSESPWLEKLTVAPVLRGSRGSTQQPSQSFAPTTVPVDRQK